MSKYMTFDSQAFANADLLIDALSDLGFTDVARGQDLALEGWDRRDKRTADIVIRRSGVKDKRLLGDIGFQKTALGYVVVIDDMDLNYKLGRDWITKLQTSYHEAAARKMAKKLGGTLTRELIGKTIKIRVRF
ncbi:MAG: DUF1257 domain-containing protein [Acidobacteria bacterium]|nr:DUF1257 domain-containing protein [Acidobacteriota bacterium]